jgi:polyhydroxyalkanoate synthesis regulator protein
MRDIILRRDKKMIQLTKYKNRKLYDKTTKSYVNLSYLQKVVEQGKMVKVTDNVTKKDITYQTLVSILNNKLSTSAMPNNESIVKLINTL